MSNRGKVCCSDSQVLRGYVHRTPTCRCDYSDKRLGTFTSYQRSESAVDKSHSVVYCKSGVISLEC